MHYSFADLDGAEGVDLGTSDWFAVNQERIQAFADATEDHQWIHTDPERAAETPFGSTIAHGYLLLSLVPKLFTEIFVLDEAEMLVNFGLDKVRFLKPVTSGAELRLQAQIEKATWRKGNLLLRIRGFLMVRESTDDDRGRRAVALETLFLAVPPEGFELPK